MVFGNPLERNIAELSEKIEELKNQRKLVELDLEKRILILEGATNSIQKLLGDLKDFEAAKDALSRLDAVQNKLREIEDVGLISRLETVQEGDKIALLEETAGELKEKVKLLSDAIEILGEAKTRFSENTDGGPKELASLKSELNSVKEAVSKLAAATPPQQKIIALEEESGKSAGAIKAIDSELRELVRTVREKLEIMERNVERGKAAELPERVMKDMAGMQKEIGQLKAIQEQAVRQIESSSKKLNDLRSLREERNDTMLIKNSIMELEKNVFMLKKEMALDRSMYPENLMKLEKQIMRLNDAGKNAVSTADFESVNNGLNALGQKFERFNRTLPEYSETMEALLEDVASLRSEMETLLKGNDLAAAEKADLKKQVSGLQRALAEMKSGLKQVVEIQGGLADEKLSIKDELTSSKDLLRETRKDIMDLSKRFGEEVSSMRKDVDAIKSAEKDAAQQSQSGFEKDFSALKKNFEELQKAIILLKKEMALDRSMYPEHIMKLEKELSAIRGIKNASAKELAAGKMQELIKPLADELKKVKDTLPKYDASIESAGRNNDLLKQGIAEVINTVKSKLAEASELRKDMAALQNQVSELRKSEGKMKPQALSDLKKEIAGASEQNAKMVQELDMKVRKIEELSRDGTEAPVRKVADDIRLLRKEFVNTKEKLSEVIALLESSIKEEEEMKAGTKLLKKEIHSVESSAGSASELASVRQRVSSLEEELGDFRQLADSLAKENRELAAGLGEACGEIAKMREKQHIIID